MTDSVYFVVKLTSQCCFSFPIWRLVYGLSIIALFAINLDGSQLCQPQPASSHPTSAV